MTTRPRGIGNQRLGRIAPVGALTVVTACDDDGVLLPRPPVGTAAFAARTPTSSHSSFSGGPRTPSSSR